MVVIINLIVIDHSRMIQAFRIIEISKYDDGGQLTTRGQLMQGSSRVEKVGFEVFPERCDRGTVSYGRGESSKELGHSD